MLYTLQFGTYTFPNTTFLVTSFPLGGNIQENLIPRKDGAVIPKTYLKPRTFKITGTIHEVDQPTALATLLSIQNALLANGENQFFYQADRYIKARLGDFQNNYSPATGLAVIDCDITLEAGDPYFFAAGLSTSDVNNFSGTGLTHNFNINNNGDVFSEPIIYICATGGTITDNIYLTNPNDNNSFLRFRSVLGNGLTLMIDSTKYTVSISGADNLLNYEGDFMNVVAGSNAFQYVGATCRLTIEHKDRYFN